jgi:hypothetical protein
MKESNYNILTERVHNLEKNMEFVVDWLEEISPDLRKANRRKEAYGIKNKG